MATPVNLFGGQLYPGLLGNPASPDQSSWAGMLDPQTAAGMRFSGVLGGLGALGAGLSAAGASRPVGQAGPSAADAFGAFGQGQQAALMNAMKTRQFNQQMTQEGAWRDAATGKPTTPAGQALFNSIPEGRRMAILAMGPQMGMETMSKVMAQRPVAARPGETISDAYGSTTRVPYTDQDFEYRRAGRSTTSVNVEQPNIGTIPPGYAAQKVNGGWQMMPVPGGPADREIKKEGDKVAAERTNTVNAGDLVIQDIDRALGMKSVLPTSGAMGGTLAKIPGTAAADTARLLDSVKANISFQTLTDMRKASPTGGALGAVSDRELALLQAAKGSLEQSQSPTQFRDNLVRLRNLTLDVVHGPGQGPSRTPLSFQSQGGGGGGAQPGATMRWNPQTQRVEPVR